MKRLATFGVLALALLLGLGGASAEQRKIVLAVDNMACVVCAYNVKKSLESVTGVLKADVSLRNHSAVVVYDDAKTDVKALTSATARVGFPSTPQK